MEPTEYGIFEHDDVMEVLTSIDGKLDILITSINYLAGMVLLLSLFIGVLFCIYIVIKMKETKRWPR